MKARSFTHSITSHLVISLLFLCLSLSFSSPAWARVVTYDFTTDEGCTALGITRPESGKGTNLGEETDYTLSSITMNISHGDGNTKTRVYNSSGSTTLRTYCASSSSTLTFSGDDMLITKIVFTAKTFNYTASDGTLSTKTWTGSAASITFTTSTTTSNEISTIEVTYAPAQCTVTLKDDNSTIQQASTGASVNLPTRTIGCEGDYTFAGWSTTSCGGSWATSPVPTIIPAGSYTPEDDIDLYPVYVYESEDFDSYVQVTSAPSDWTGKYLISAYSAPDTYTAFGFSNKHLSVVSNINSKEHTDYEFTLTKVGDVGYSILLPDGTNYLGYDSSTDFKQSTTVPTTETTDFLWTPSTSQIKNVATSTRYIRLFTSSGGESDFRAYTSGTPKALLYKRTEKIYYSSANPCGSCEVSPILGTVSLEGVYTTSGIGVTCSGITVGENCEVEASKYGFIWYAGDATDKVYGDDGVDSIRIRTDYSSGAFAATISSTFIASNQYTIRAFAENDHGLAYSTAYTFTFNPITVTWKKNDVEYTTGSPTTSVRSGMKVLQLPTAPADDALGDDCTNTFVGWSTHNGGTTASDYSDLFTNIAGSPTISAATTFYAVFADRGSASKVGTTLWSEDWTGFSNDNKPTAPINVEYSGILYDITEANSTAVKTGTMYAGGTSPELLIEKNDIFAVRNIPSYMADTLLLTYKRNNTLTVSTNSTGYSIASDRGGSSPYTDTIICGTASTFNISFTAGSSNVRLDDIVLKVKSVPYSYYSTTSNCKIVAADAEETTWSAVWGGSEPTIDDVVRINKSISVDAADATAKEIILGTDAALTINAGAALVLANSISKSDGSAPSASNLSLKSSSSNGNAALIYDPSAGEIEATVEMYSKVSTGNWQYVAVPYKDVTASGSEIYSAGNLYGWVVGTGWVEVGSSEELEPFVGYAVTNSAPVTFSLAGTLVTTTDTAIAVGAYKNRVVGNSWTAPIQISQMTSDDFTGGLNGNQTVYLFNTGSDPNGTGSESTSSDRYAAGTYVTVPINVAGTESLPSVISSMQGFYVKNRHATYEGTFKLNYGKHVRPTGTNTPINGTMHAPKRTTKNADDPTTLNIKVSGTNYDDVLLLLEREDFTNAYDGGWDGDKMGDNKSAPRIYTLREDGTKDAVSAVPDLAGKELVFRAGTTDSQYTMSFSYDEDAEDLYLYDNETNTYTQVLTDNTYTFSTTDKAEHPRFTLLRANAPQIATGVENVQSDGVQCTKAHKELRDGQLLIHRGGHTYNAAGILVK